MDISGRIAAITGVLLDGPSLVGVLPALTGSITCQDWADISGEVPAPGGLLTGVEGAALVGKAPALAGYIHGDAVISGSLPAIVATELHGGAAIKGSTPSISALFSVVAEEEFAFYIKGKTPVLSSSFDISVSGVISGKIPVLGGGLIGHGEIAAQLSGKMPAISGTITAQAYGHADISGKLPAMGFSMSAGYPDWEISAEIAPMTGRLSGVTEDSIRWITDRRPLEDSIIRNRRGYDNG